MAELSPKQRKIIELRDCNILVSAAAGSGKTSVLVERIIRRITDDIDPVDIDRILVLTFTRAAAGVMRSRIADGISSLIEEHPEDERLKRQAGLIYNARITTIDSFCLDIVRNNFTEIGLEPGFRVADPKEIKLLEDEALDEVIEEVLSARDMDSDMHVEHLDEFLDHFESKDSMRRIKESITDVYKEADKAPFLEDYIETRRQDYAVNSVQDIENSLWFASYMQDTKNMIVNAEGKIKRLKQMCENEGPAEYIPVCDSDKEYADRLYEASSYEEMREAAASGAGWVRLPGKATCEPEIKKKAGEIRKLYKDIINKVVSDRLAYPLDVQAEYMKKTEKAVNALLDIVLHYHERLTDKKKDKGLWTFSDIEHMALRILLKRKDNTYVPTRVALDLRKVYRELMIDEYQDSNRTQEWLIHAISGEDDGIFDRFIVGDVKQSIYRFRNADPTLFMEKYEEYTPDGGDRTRIDLSMNYRSRRQVLDTVNSVFEKVMDKEIGGVDYDEDNKLYYGGVFGEAQDEDPKAEEVYKSELMLLKYDKGSELSKPQQEAMLIASRIKRLIKEQPIFVKETGEYRKCEFKDIVILMRSIPAEIDDMRHILEAYGIPVHTPSKGGYFDATEIVTVLNYLKILNNPGDDIALFGALKSIFGGFDENELSVIKLAGINLYDGLHVLANMSAEAPKSDDCSSVPERLKDMDRDMVCHIGEKASVFLEEYEHMRSMVPYTPVHKLIRYLYEKYDYVEYVSALPAGNQRKANVLALLSKAEGYNANGFGGIFDFCRYIDRLHKYESDEGEVMTLGENENVVRIMTMHKSKGLEFPVCILASLHKQFNFQGPKSGIVFHAELGMGVDHVDPDRRIKLKCIRKRAINERIKRDSISEEMRVLYVAMTRAEEKLIMSALIDPDKEENGEYDGDPHDISERMSINSFYKILMMTRGNNDWNGQCSVQANNLEDIESEQVNDIGNEGVRRETFNEKMTEMSPQDMVAADELKNKIVFKYPHQELEGLYTKTSVSELKMAAIHDGLTRGDRYDVPDEFFKLHEEDAYIPSFARKEEAGNVSGAAVGSAVHRVMELLDFKDITDFGIEDLDRQMNVQIEAGTLLKEDYELVNKEKIVGFVRSDIGARMSAAAKKGRLYREKPFVLGINADRLNSRFPSEETVLIQGIIDVFFIEDDHIVLLDYKTDSVKTGEELVLRYKTQMDYYEEALRRITGSDVTERILYSFALNEPVSCQI